MTDALTTTHTEDQEVTVFIKKIGDLVVSDQISYNQVLGAAKAARAKEKELEERRLGITRPMRESIDAIIQLFAGPIERLQAFQKQAKKIAEGWLDAEAAKQHEKQRQNNEAAAKEKARIAAEAAKQREKEEVERRKAEEARAAARTAKDKEERALRDAEAAKAEATAKEAEAAKNRDARKKQEAEAEAEAAKAEAREKEAQAAREGEREKQEADAREAEEKAKAAQTKADAKQHIADTLEAEKVKPTTEAHGLGKTINYNPVVEDKKRFITWCLNTDRLEYLDVNVKLIKRDCQASKGTRTFEGIRIVQGHTTRMGK